MQFLEPLVYLEYLEYYPLDGILAALLVWALYTDLTRRIIPNRLILVGIVAGFLLNAILQGPQAGLLFSVQGLLLGVGLLFIPFALGGLGAGDVKLLGLVGALKGAGFVFHVFIAAALLGGILSLAALLRAYHLPTFLKNALQSLYLLPVRGLAWQTTSAAESSAGKCKIPYAPAIVLGVLAVYVWQHLAGPGAG